MVFGKKKKEEPTQPETPPAMTETEEISVGSEPKPKLPVHIETGILEFQNSYAGLFSEGSDYKADLNFAVWQELRAIRRVLERIEKNA